MLFTFVDPNNYSSFKTVAIPGWSKGWWVLKVDLALYFKSSNLVHQLIFNWLIIEHFILLTSWFNFLKKPRLSTVFVLLENLCGLWVLGHFWVRYIDNLLCFLLDLSVIKVFTQNNRSQLVAITYTPFFHNPGVTFLLRKLAVFAPYFFTLNNFPWIKLVLFACFWGRSLFQLFQFLYWLRGMTLGHKCVIYQAWHRLDQIKSLWLW